jgi:hypothetical protein
MWSRVGNHTVVREMWQLWWRQLDERRIRCAGHIDSNSCACVVGVSGRHRDRAQFVLEYGERVENSQQSGS